MKINKLRLLNKTNYLIADLNNFNSAEEFLNEIAARLNNGVQIVQLVTTNITPKEIIDCGKRVRELCSIYEALLIIEGRVDIAQILHADGIHLNKNDISVTEAKYLTEGGLIIGFSAENEQLLKEALTLDVDYIFTKENLNGKNIIHFQTNNIKKI